MLWKWLQQWSLTFFGSLQILIIMLNLYVLSFMAKMLFFIENVAKHTVQQPIFTIPRLLRLGKNLDHVQSGVTYVFLGAIQILINMWNLYLPFFMAKLLYFIENVAKTLCETANFYLRKALTTRNLLRSC